MKKGEEAMEILEAYDVTGSLRGAAALAGCDHKTVARLVAAREEAGGGLPERVRSRPLVDAFAEKIDELVDRSRAQVRAEAEQLVVVRIDPDQGPREVARHPLTTPGRPSIDDAHYPPRPAGALERRPRARSAQEREFLQIGDGAERWLKRAAAEGTSRIRRKMAEAVDLAKLHGTGPVNEALQRCATYGRFGDGDLASVLAYHQQSGGELLLFPARSEDHSLQRSTSSWEGIGR